MLKVNTTEYCISRWLKSIRFTKYLNDTADIMILIMIIKKMSINELYGL